MKQVECNKCGKTFEVEGEWGYCPFCENDNVEVFKNQLLNVQIVSSKEISKLHKKLEEKDKELTRLKKNWNNSKTQQQRLYYNLKQNQYQDKIELLENIKEMIKNMSIGIGIEIYGTRIKPIEEYIDCQIEELKKGMK